jgi:hypothetical protein
MNKVTDYNYSKYAVNFPHGMEWYKWTYGSYNQYILLANERARRKVVGRTNRNAGWRQDLGTVIPRQKIS